MKQAAHFVSCPQSQNYRPERRDLEDRSECIKTRLASSAWSRLATSEESELTKRRKHSRHNQSYTPTKAPIRRTTSRVKRAIRSKTIHLAHNGRILRTGQAAHGGIVSAVAQAHTAYVLADFVGGFEVCDEA